ncbi:hypothetical protein Pmani_016042 [Petrolisthes manimaculis]|uniref:Uncharacterized protein n=1 Tax=Petrolisthes manimaculis TaxID=1843537 RepID=A0AAE1UAZ9_9EUCA|nr:hypothetical protein Pmani_016042 [Petrolisthes manimaculis]
MANQTVAEIAEGYGGLFRIPPAAPPQADTGMKEEHTVLAIRQSTFLPLQSPCLAILQLLFPKKKQNDLNFTTHELQRTVSQQSTAEHDKRLARVLEDSLSRNRRCRKEETARGSGGSEGGASTPVTVSHHTGRGRESLRDFSRSASDSDILTWLARWLARSSPASFPLPSSSAGLSLPQCLTASLLLPLFFPLVVVVAQSSTIFR